MCYYIIIFINGTKLIKITINCENNNKLRKEYKVQVMKLLGKNGKKFVLLLNK